MAPSLRKSILVSLILLLGGFRTAPANAMPPIETFLAAGREYAVDQRVANQRVEVRQAERAEASGRLLPAINIQGGYTRNQYNIETQIPTSSGGTRGIVISAYNQLDALFQLEVPMLDLAQLRRIEAARLGVDAARLDTEVVGLDVDRQVVRAYYQMVGADAVAASAREAERVARENLRVVESRVTAGLASSLDRERAAAEVEARVQTVAESDLLRRQARRQIRALTNLTVAEDDTTTFDVALEGDPPLDHFVSAIDRLPTVRASETRIELARAQQRAARSAFVPTISGLAEERITNVYGFSYPRQWLVQVVARVRLDFSKSAQIDIADANAALASLEEERARINARDGIENAYDQVVANLARTQAARAQVVAATQAADVANQRYGVGSASQLEVVQANRDKFAAEVQRVQAEAELEFARALLRIVAGFGMDE